MLAKLADDDPRGRRLAVRAEVGRLPLRRLPRRRRDRAGQPQRAAVHPLLPRAARAAARRAPGSVRRRRRDRRAGERRPRPRLRRAAAAHPSRRSRASAASPPRRRRRSSPSTSSPSATRSLLDTPLAERHARLVDALALDPAQPVYLCPSTTDADVARRLVRRVRGRRPRRRDRQAARRSVHARQAHADQGQAPPHGRLRGRRLPRPQGRQGRRVDAARSVRRRRSAEPRRRRRLVHRQAPRRAADRARAADPRRARGPPVARLGGVDDHGGERAADARRRQPVERRQGPLVGAAAHRARRRGDLRPAAGGPLPPRLDVPALASRPRRRRAAPTTSSRSPSPCRSARSSPADSRRARRFSRGRTRRSTPRCR